MGPRAGVDGCGKSRPPPGFDHRTVRPEAIRYTDYAIPAHLFTVREVCSCQVGLGQKVSGMAGLWPVFQDIEVIGRKNWGGGKRSTGNSFKCSPIGPYPTVPWRWRQQGTSKRRWSALKTETGGGIVIPQKNCIHINTAMEPPLTPCFAVKYNTSYNVFRTDTIISLSKNRRVCTQFHLIHDSSRQQYWFDNTWRCMYSFVLLMMGGGTAWNT
jgi:hypothetical protein